MNNFPCRAKALLLLSISLAFLAGCISQPSIGGNAKDSSVPVGESIVINALVRDASGSNVGVEAIDENTFKVNPALSSRQEIIVTIGNRSGEEILFRDSSFSCRGKNTRGNDSNTALILEDAYFECINCPEGESCRLESIDSRKNTSTNCSSEKGGKILSIGKEKGLNLIAAVISPPSMEGTALCTLNLETYGGIKRKEFTIIYAGQ